MGYDKEIQQEKEQDAWVTFKASVQECLSLQFSEKQLTAHIQIKYCDIKGGIKGVDIHE